MKTNVRYFKIELESLEIVEINEGEFLELVGAGWRIQYERHTVRENGVSQICLTVDDLGRA